MGQVAARNGGGAVQVAPEAPTAPLRLCDLEFTDLYLSVNGEAFMRGLIDSRNPLYDIPEGSIEDLHQVHGIVCQMGQDADEFTLDHDEVRYRVSKIPDEVNPTYCLRRALDPIPRLREFGINPLVFRELGLAGKGKGLILVTGSTGQGKTTLACSLLQEYLMAYGEVAIAIEDPPELKLAGKHGNFGQCYQIRVKDGDFASPLRKAMRQFPRYIFLGEIRDGASAAEALQACISGHLVVATTHAGSIEDAITRIMKLVSSELDLDLAKDMLSTGLSVVTSQEMRRIATADGRAERKVVLKTLFFGDDMGLRALVRGGTVSQIKTTIEAQARRVQMNQMPLKRAGEGAAQAGNR